MRLIRARTFMDKLGVRKSKFYELEAKDPDFPKSLREGRIAYYLESEADAYIAKRVQKLQRFSRAEATRQQAAANEATVAA